MHRGTKGTRKHTHKQILNTHPTCWPDARMKAPMEAAMPMTHVLTSGRTWRMVSNTAIPAKEFGSKVVPYNLSGFFLE
jgi:hypothetical protein